MRHLILSLVILLGLLGFVHAGTIDPTVEDSKYIEYGNQHECVVQIGGEYSDQSKKGQKIGFLASAVIIKPRIALTAAHVVKNGRKMYIIINERKIDILFAVMLKAYDQNKVGPFDIAICYLKESSELDFYPKLYEKNDEVGKVCSIAGYGITGNHRQGAKIHDGKKRAGSNHVDELFNGMLVCSLNSRPYTSLEFLIAHGDSGGGLFIDQKLAGINSTIMTHKGGILNSDIQDQSCHTRISIHKPWIDFIVEEIYKGTLKNTKVKFNLLNFSK